MRGFQRGEGWVFCIMGFCIMMKVPVFHGGKESVESGQRGGKRRKKKGVKKLLFDDDYEPVGSLQMKFSVHQDLLRSVRHDLAIAYWARVNPQWYKNVGLSDITFFQGERLRLSAHR
jgi:hypothetical protein